MTAPEAARAVTIGYLTTVYPAVSHSFVRREIQALEGLGVTVKRWSIRPPAKALPDPLDRAEAERTDVILGRTASVILAAMASLVLTPLALWRAARVSLCGRPAGLKALLVRLAYVAEAAYLVRAARRCGVDHVHAHFGTNSASVARLSRVLGGPDFSFTVHGPDEFDQPLVHDLRGKIADAAFVVAISHYGRSQLMRWSPPADWAKLAVVRCGLDPQFLENPAADLEPRPVRTLSCVARLAPQKGLPVLVEAADLLRRSVRDFKIVIVGDGDLRQALEQDIAARGMRDHFEFRGWASAAEVRDVILGSRAFVLPSFAEGLPVAIMEALALQRPVITTRIAGIPELVDEQCGWLVDAGEPEALAAAMAAALDATPEDLAAMGREGLRRVALSHNATVNASVLYGHIAKTLGLPV